MQSTGQNHDGQHQTISSATSGADDIADISENNIWNGTPAVHQWDIFGLEKVEWRTDVQKAISDGALL